MKIGDLVRHRKEGYDIALRGQIGIVVDFGQRAHRFCAAAEHGHEWEWYDVKWLSGHGGLLCDRVMWWHIDILTGAANENR